MIQRDKYKKMKGLLLVLFSAVLVLQSASAFPKFRVRREVQSQPDLNLSAKADKKRSELFDYLVEELIGVVKHSIESHKKLFENVLKYADEDELKSDALKEAIAKFSNLVGQANALTDEKTPETLEKVFNLNGECTELVNEYYELENPTEEEKLITRILDENGGSPNLMVFLIDFIKLRSNYKAHIQEYVDSLSEDDKVKDGKFLEWFTKFKSTHDNDFDNFIEITIEVFEFFRDDAHWDILPRFWRLFKRMELEI